MYGRRVDRQYDAMPIDPQEEERRTFEERLKQGVDISLAPGSTTDGQEEEDYSVEYPRHGPSHSPLPFDPYSSYARSVNHFDFAPEEPQQYYQPRRQQQPEKQQRQYMSHRTEDDTYGHGGETASSLGHHRSAVTIGAGLGAGRQDSPREGREYDSDRQVDRLLDHRGNMSMFDDTPRSKRSQNPGSAVRQRIANNKSRDMHSYSQPTFDPLIVEDTAEIDRAVEAGHLQFNNIPAIHPRIPRNQSRDDDTISQPESDGSSFHRSEPPTPPARLKLSDALERVAEDRYGSFSPRRHAFSPTASPRPRAAAALRRPSSPGEPSAHSSGSKFGKMAKGLTKEIEEGRREAAEWDEANARAQRHPLVNIANQTADSPFQGAAAQRPKRSATLPILPVSKGSKVQLPDMTGITMAVETPLKTKTTYRVADAAENKQLNAAIEEIAARLRQVERENTTARRRVRELELELDDCREEVQRERTRFQEQVRKQQERSFEDAAASRDDRKGKRRQTDIAADDEESRYWEKRYKDTVEQKEALEALVETLRAHGSRMTRELEDRQRDLDDLRQLRERDAKELRSKLQEVEDAHVEIEKLAVEVERLRDIVEDGLRERRKAKETDEMLSRVGMGGDLSTVREASNEDEEDQERSRDNYSGQAQHHRYTYPPPGQDDGGYETQTDVDGEEEYYQPAQPKQNVQIELQEATLEYTQGNMTQPDVAPPIQQQQQRRPRSGSVASTVRSTSRMSSRGPSPRFGHALVPSNPIRRPLSRISSRGDPGDDATTSSLGHPLPSGSRRFISEEELRRLEADVEERRSERSGNMSREVGSNADDPNLSRASSDPGRAPSRASMAAGARTKLNRHHSSPPTAMMGGTAPVPRIRGERAEKLFYAETNHDASTCTKCHRKKKDQATSAVHEEWLATFLRRRAPSRLGKDAAEGVEDPGRVPPQTVLSRVVNEMEGEFTHYKSIYIELADQYALMDAASNVAKRNVLAEHLREVIDILEQKGDQIASLYDLLAFRDRPVSPNGGRTSPVAA